MNEFYLYPLIALLPLTAVMLVIQYNPYHALVIRGFLGAVAAMVYSILGGADVALTEALVGTMLSIMLYAIAVRSSLVLRLGILTEAQIDERFEQLLTQLRQILGKRYLRLELVPYPDAQALEKALAAKEVHATCIQNGQPYTTITRIRRIYEIMQSELKTPEVILTYLEEKHQP
ncbi:DUF4040 domain-containing protein [Gloeocapsa sp. PCC 73106]|uniref:DUF4040 domain-containing protein n=1 Tax=Gloeocapsa sp. PCC 73106 TaxID=102232 RepID=UPI0002AD0A2D|nr:DUF4040 domain-containing protein [Gloeocapsa sp. PCC 73106]ELR97650.1 putative subunit of the multisubunit Na+/H+ antiporter [Gloeocapsa sp. PCC 73106]